jgi:hypothetical protein
MNQNFYWLSPRGPGILAIELLRLHLKYFSEVRDDPIFDVVHVNFVAEQIFHGRYLLAIARDDQIEETKICVHIKREAVRGHPTRNVHSDSRYLAP